MVKEAIASSSLTAAGCNQTLGIDIDAAVDFCVADILVIFEQSHSMCVEIRKLHKSMKRRENLFLEKDENRRL